MHMPEALICPCCGASYNQGATQCKYCKVYFSTGSGSSPEAVQSGAGLDLPPGWVQYNDAWNGFSLVHPPGWKVYARKGAIGIREDPAGVSSAGIYTQRLAQQTPAREFLQYYISVAHNLIPNLLVWEAPADDQAADHSLARYEGDYLDCHIAGIYDIHIQNQQVFLAGFGCPTGQLQAKKKWFQDILASFKPIQAMQRQKHQEVSEGAYVVWAPIGWQVDAKLDRQHINNAATPQLVIKREPQGLAQAALMGGTWNFSMAPTLFGSSIPVLPYLTGTQFFQNCILPQISQQCQDLQVVEIIDRPDLAMIQVGEMQKVGMNPNEHLFNSAHMIISYIEQGIHLRQYGQVDCIGSPGAALGGTWSAYLSNVYRAPDQEFDDLQPILIGALDSIVYNPAWQQAQEASKQAYLRASFQDRMNRLGQISQTIHEMNEMVGQSYERRQASEDRLRHEWSNATLGVQDMSDQTGTVYSVPSGYDQYWRDGLDNLYVGDWLTNPDPTWTRLEPT
jgi:hypothetical protein